jgi:hypothetical protein
MPLVAIHKCIGRNSLQRAVPSSSCSSCAAVGFGVPQPNTRTVRQSPWFHIPRPCRPPELWKGRRCSPISLLRRRTGGPMNRRTTFIIGSFALVGFAAVAHAQTESRPRTGGMSAAPGARSTAKPAVRTASIPASPPAQPIVVYTTGLPGTQYGSPVPTPVAPGYGAPLVVSQITWYPTVVLTDGRVLANFGTGRGYEQVLRQCAQVGGVLPYGASMAPCWTVDAYGRYSVIQQR